MTSKGKKRFLSILRMPENKDKSLHYAVLGLALMGSFMIVSTNVGNTTSNSLAIVTVSIKQILFIIAGYTAMMLASKLMNFRLIYRLDKILVFVVLGGIGSTRGSIIAAVILTALPEYLRSLNDYRMLIYSIVLILLMLANNNERLNVFKEKISITNFLRNRKKGNTLDKEAKS